LVSYGFGELDALVPAYAASVHKSQDSDHPAVVIPLMTQHYAMLQRNSLCTGVTRGKRPVVLVGQKKAVAIAVRNILGRRRWSKLAEWLSADVSKRYVSVHDVGRHRATLTVGEQESTEQINCIVSACTGQPPIADISLRRSEPPLWGCAFNRSVQHRLQSIGRRLEAQGLSRTLIEPQSNCVQITLRDAREIGSSQEVLPQQAVGVLV
jgi:hypothetical protein